jgi:hypothetical protein
VKKLKTMQIKGQTFPCEQTVIRIMRKLSPEQVQELVDFARFLEFRMTNKDEGSEANDVPETTESMTASEEQWEQLLARPEAKRVLRDMAREALEDYRAGRTTEITISKEGRLEPA